MSQANSDVVFDDGKSKFSDIWRKEDYWAIWLGFAVLIVGYCLFAAQVPGGFAEKLDKANSVMQAEAAKAPFKTIEFLQAQDSKLKLKARDS